jgi:hypothetical protein
MIPANTPCRIDGRSYRFTGALEVRAKMLVDSSSYFYRNSFSQLSARRANGDEVFITGDYRGEVEQLRRLLMRAARRNRMRMLQLAELAGLAEMEDLTTNQDHEEGYVPQLAEIETETLELPSLGYVPEPEEAVDLAQAMEDFKRDVFHCNELDLDTLDEALAVAANQYRWARFWVIRHPDPKVRAKFAEALGEAAPLRAKVRQRALAHIAKHEERRRRGQS